MILQWKYYMKKQTLESETEKNRRAALLFFYARIQSEYTTFPRQIVFFTFP